MINRYSKGKNEKKIPGAPGLVQYVIGFDYLGDFEILLNLQTFYLSKAFEELERHSLEEAQQPPCSQKA